MRLRMASASHQWKDQWSIFDSNFYHPKGPIRFFPPLPLALHADPLCGPSALVNLSLHYPNQEIQNEIIGHDLHMTCFWTPILETNVTFRTLGATLTQFSDPGGCPTGPIFGPRI